MEIGLHPVVLDLVAAGLALGVAAAALAGRPAIGLRGPLLAFDLAVLAYVVGDALRRLSLGPGWDGVAAALLHAGGFPAAAACWMLALRYAQVLGREFTHVGRAWVWLPLSLAALAWAITVTNPWHGLVVVPGGEPHQVRAPVGVLLWAIGVALAGGSVALLAVLARRSTDTSVRRNALAMAGGIALALGFGLIDVLAPHRLPIDLTVLGMCGAMLVFLFASYRTRLFQLLPVAAREVLLHSRDGMLLATPSGRLLYVNPAGAEMLGLRADSDASGLHALLDARLRDAEGAPLDARALLARLLAAPHGAGDSVVQTEDGQRWLRLHTTAIPRRSGAPAALSLQLTDVSDEQRAVRALERGRDELERRIADRTAALRASEERYRHVSELSADTAFGCCVRPGGSIEMEWLSRDVKLLFTPGAAADLVDLRSWSAVLHPDDREPVIEAARGLGAGQPCDLEFRITASGGEQKWLELHARVVSRDPDGSLKVVGALRDVSERRRAEAERLALEQRVQEAQRLESLGGLAGGIAHDFNNLVSIVLGNTTLGLQELPPAHPTRARLERIRAAGEYATQLTEQMLTYAGRARPKLAALDLSRVVEEMLDLLEASARPCPLLTELAQGLPPVGGDETQIRQVLMNLVSNAQQASSAPAPIHVRTGRMRAGRGWLAEAVGAPLPEGDLVYVEVQDAGAGMDAATRMRVFEPFYSTRTAGRGLGLAVVLGIVRSHHGAIHLDTAPGAGATFRVVLPPAPQRASAPKPAQSEPRADIRAEAGEVLVCDDDAGVRELTAELLGRAGFRVHLAERAAECLALIAERGSALCAALVDLKLPDGDAGTVLRALAEQGARVPVIVATGHSEEQAAQLLGGLRPAGYLRKPWTPEALLAALRAAAAQADDAEPDADA